MSLFVELKRRNVFRVGIAYVVTAWLTLQVADIVLDNTPAPEWIMQVIMLLLAIGFPIALLFAWAFELTPEGLKKEKDVDRSQSITQSTGRRLDFAIIAVLTVTLGYFAWEKFTSQKSTDIPATAGVLGDSSQAETATGSSDHEPAYPAPPEKSIAVLPFVNLSSDPEQEYFSDGISEELLNVLAQFPGVRVAARTSSFQFKGQNQDIGEIARMLKVKNVLEGSVRKSGNRLRITAQLIEADTGYHLWSETYDRELNDIFAIQDEISAAIGEALRVELALNDDQAPAAPRVAESANTAAYEAFLRGRHLINQRGRSNIMRAVEDLKRSVRLDPDFAPAHAWMAIAWALMLDSPATYGDLSLAEVKERATPHIERALKLNPDLAVAYGAKGLLAITASDLDTAMAATARALELNPVYLDAMNWRQIAASNSGDYRTSLEIIQRIVEVDPLSIIGRLNYSSTLANEDMEAGRAMAHGLVDQNAWAGYTALGTMEFQSGRDLSTSLGWYLRAYGVDPHDELSNRYLIRILANVGEYEEARRISDGSLHIVDIEQGRLESAIHTLQRAHASDPENYAPLTDLADVLHFASRFDESLPYYQQLSAQSPTGIVADSLDGSTRPTLRMAWGYLQSGNKGAAKIALAMHREDMEKRQSLNAVYFWDYLAEAMAQSVEGNTAEVFTSIQTAIDMGFRNLAFFREPSMGPVAQHPEFLALKAEVEQLLVVEHAEILQLICHDNPIPDIWRPMQKTCVGVEAGP